LDEERVKHLLIKRIERVKDIPTYARKIGVNETNIRRFLYGERPPAKNILQAMGLEKVVFYRYRKKVAKPKQGRFGTIYGEADE